MFLFLAFEPFIIGDDEWYTDWFYLGGIIAAFYSLKEYIPYDALFSAGETAFDDVRRFIHWTGVIKAIKAAVRMAFGRLDWIELGWLILWNRLGLAHCLDWDWEEDWVYYWVDYYLGLGYGDEE